MVKETQETLLAKGHTVDLEKVKPVKEHSFWTWFFLRSFIGTTKIKDLKIKNVSEYDLIVIGSPNWTRLSLPMTAYLKKVRGIKYKSVALLSTTALWPNLEWYLLSSYLLDFTFEKA
jgi:hypothetical protein